MRILQILDQEEMPRKARAALLSGRGPDTTDWEIVYLGVLQPGWLARWPVSMADMVPYINHMAGRITPWYAARGCLCVDRVSMEPCGWKRGPRRASTCHVARRLICSPAAVVQKIHLHRYMPDGSVHPPGRGRDLEHEWTTGIKPNADIQIASAWVALPAAASSHKMLFGQHQ